MVLLVDIYVGQYVQVRLKDKIVFGTVRYKGHLNGVEGDWVGVELEYPLGKHNGVWRGRQYFSASPNHGIFTHACNLRHHRKARSSKDTYKKVNDESSFDETLFAPIKSSSSPSTTATHHNNPEVLAKSGKIGCYSIDLGYLQRAKKGFKESSSSWHQREYHPLSHSVGSCPSELLVKNHPHLFPSFTEPVSGADKESSSGNSKYFSSLHASIPHYTMPHSLQLKQVKKKGGWNNKTKKPRFISV